MNFVLTGDTHRAETINRILRIKQQYQPDPVDNLLGVIILGDSGINYFLDDSDQEHKTIINELGVVIYCVRGNHEQRPELIKNMKKIFDTRVQGWVYNEPQFPNICYFMDGREYLLNNKSVFVLGGAYSVDKNYRLATGKNWFEQEQLSVEERNEIFRLFKGQHFDIILSHTCPYTLRPTDMFLSFIDQSTVDSSMEVWLENFRNSITYDTWCWGHYHDDRIQTPNHYMLYRRFYDINEIYNNLTDLEDKG